MKPDYERLGRWLGARFDSGEREITLAFAQIEDLIGGKLPASARKGRAFWANDITHSHAHSWLFQGFETMAVSLKQESLTFRFNRRVVEMNLYNNKVDLIAFCGNHELNKISIREAKRKQPTQERDRAALEAVREGLQRAGSAQLRFLAQIHEPPQRGRRTQSGYGTISVWESADTSALLRMEFDRGHVLVTRMLGPRGLAAVRAGRRSD